MYSQHLGDLPHLIHLVSAVRYVAPKLLLHLPTQARERQMTIMGLFNGPTGSYMILYDVTNVIHNRGLPLSLSEFIKEPYNKQTNKRILSDIVEWKKTQ